MTNEPKDRVTTMHVHRSTLTRLRRLKRYERETDEDIIKRLLNERENKQLIVVE